MTEDKKEFNFEEYITENLLSPDKYKLKNISDITTVSESRNTINKFIKYLQSANISKNIEIDILTKPATDTEIVYYIYTLKFTPNSQESTNSYEIKKIILSAHDNEELQQKINKDTNGIDKNISIDLDNSTVKTTNIDDPSNYGYTEFVDSDFNIFITENNENFYFFSINTNNSNNVKCFRYTLENEKYKFVEKLKQNDRPIQTNETNETNETDETDLNKLYEDIANLNDNRNLVEMSKILGNILDSFADINKHINDRTGCEDEVCGDKLLRLSEIKSEFENLRKRLRNTNNLIKTIIKSINLINKLLNIKKSLYDTIRTAIESEHNQSELNKINTNIDTNIEFLQTLKKQLEEFNQQEYNKLKDKKLEDKLEQLRTEKKENYFIEIIINNAKEIANDVITNMRQVTTYDSFKSELKTNIGIINDIEISKIDNTNFDYDKIIEYIEIINLRLNRIKSDGPVSFNDYTITDNIRYLANKLESYRINTGGKKKQTSNKRFTVKSKRNK